MSTKFAAISDIQRHRSALGSRIDHLGFRLRFGCQQRRFSLFQLSLARFSDGTIHATGQRRCFRHQRTGTAQRRGGSIHITLLQHDLAATQIRFGKLPLVLLKGLIVGGFFLQSGQLVFGSGQFAAGQALLQLCDGRSPRIGDFSHRRRTLAGAQQH